MRTKPNKNRRTVAFCLFAACAIFSSGCGYSALDPGNPMPGLSAEGWVNGSAPDVAGKVVVIEAFATW